MVTESGAGIEVADEIEDIPVGETQALTVTLAAGKYVLLCNIYDETEKEAHYKMGMRIALDVTGYGPVRRGRSVGNARPPERC